MKNKFNVDWLSLESESDIKKIKMWLCDNSSWGYDRWGVGMNKGRVFVVDVDDSGERYRELLYCDKVKSVEELLKIGVECGMFEIEDDGEYFLRWEFKEEDNKKFNDMVGMMEGCGKLYDGFIVN